jgi:hypothetical protein
MKDYSELHLYKIVYNKGTEDERAREVMITRRKETKCNGIFYKEGRR